MNFDRVLEVVNKSKDIINKKGVESIRSSGRVFRQFSSYDGKDKVNEDRMISFLVLENVELIYQNKI